ncbi:hypothetical protein QBC46DRAFT_456692 [Diplogelasinospora grovesii]|uniref:Uncharacterized protein n=1 Tax=Diplogelasinospora grovesii TaxID=303347 RepID=A0AAN6S763_9PEZI|nr:hypothetical protein QBC46DRAFT_456692 [Diplogelasinospora grovesii]
MAGERRNSLSPPTRIGTEDPGAHELAEASDSDEHYSDAQSGPAESHRTSPIPRTRVERVDDKPAYGEVPGTKAYALREGDAAPDEIAIIPDALNTGKTGLAAEHEDGEDRTPMTPGGHPIPKTVVEETPDADGSVTHEEDQEKHRADPPPDLVLKADGNKVEGGDDGGAAPDTPISPSLKTPTTASRARRKSSSASRRAQLTPASFGDDGEDGGDEDDFGDEFDEFEEGGGDDDGDDFGDFDDSFQEPAEAPAPAAAAPAPAPPPAQPSLSFPIPDFTSLDADDIMSLTEPYLNALFPMPDDDDLPPLSKDNTHPIFLTPRSASLWSQLVAPPPLQPPDWIRSRIRRLFLVSLGVPVDLDEILPASSKQKKLILPSLHHVNSSGSLRKSTDSRGNLKHLRSENNGSSTSLDSQGKQKPKRSSDRNLSPTKQSPNTAAGGSGSGRKGPPPEPAFDLVAAKQLCATTDQALSGMTDTELKEHIKRLEDMQSVAGEVLKYWQQRTDEKIGDREAFEGVIENLVKHARKTRK